MVRRATIVTAQVRASLLPSGLVHDSDWNQISQIAPTGVTGMDDPDRARELVEGMAT
jgi:hypothetical protein